jgi:hypothetical protein
MLRLLFTVLRAKVIAVLEGAVGSVVLVDLAPSIIKYTGNSGCMSKLLGEVFMEVCLLGLRCDVCLRHPVVNN